MEPVRMQHPAHGFTHAYDLNEVKRLEGFGWSPEKKEAAEPVIERKKPGRKPKAVA